MYKKQAATYVIFVNNVVIANLYSLQFVCILEPSSSSFRIYLFIMSNSFLCQIEHPLETTVTTSDLPSSEIGL